MDIINRILEAGVVGAGGAGFPTHVKLNTSVDTFIVNGIECEPLLETDKYLMREHAGALVEIIEIIQDHLKAAHAVIGIKDKNKKEIEALKNAIKVSKSSVEVKAIGNYYPAGDEHILVQEVCGRSIPPAGIPLDVGAVVLNVATLLDVKRALEGLPVISRVITVTGDVKKPTLIQVPIGTSIKACLDLAGGPKKTNYTVLMGGPMMGRECKKDAVDTTFVTKTLGGLVVIDDDSYLITMKRLPMSHIIRRAESACIQCQMCTDLCPRYLNGHPLFPHKVMRAIGMHEKNLHAIKSALICCECGVCELYACPMGLSPKTVNQFVKKELIKTDYQVERDSYVTYEPLDMMPYRKIHTQRMMARTGLMKYEGIHFQEMVTHKPDKVTILLKQHIGGPAVPIIKDGQWVDAGTKIASINQGGLGANIHASISGTVKAEANAIVIEHSDHAEVLP